MNEPRVARGLENVIAAVSSITWVDGERNRLSYRGYDVVDLARDSTYEEVSFLLWTGRLPSSEELRQVRSRFLRERIPSRDLLDFIGALPSELAPLDALRTIVSLGSASQGPRGPLGHQDLSEVAIQLTAIAPSLLTSFWRRTHMLPKVPPKKGMPHASYFLQQITGKVPDPVEAREFEAMMILHADHEMNTSTFAARVAASTGCDMASAVTAALATLKGPLHGGASELVMKMVKEIGSPDRVESYVRRKISQHERLMGFGHRIYKGEDPRATLIRELARDLSQRRSKMDGFVILEKLAETVLKEKHLHPNVDLYSGLVYELLGVPNELYSSIFAVSRMSGWTAHVIEEYANRKLICPMARYEGPRDLTYPVTETTRISG